MMSRSDFSNIKMIHPIAKTEDVVLAKCIDFCFHSQCKVLMKFPMEINQNPTFMSQFLMTTNEGPKNLIFFYLYIYLKMYYVV